MESQKDELYVFLHSIELLQYYDAFRREGFERLESIADIQESDFEALGVKRGHRRVIQRKALELVSPLQYPRGLPPIGSPLLSAHHGHQSSAEPAPSPPLGESKPLTAYLHRQHSHQQSQQLGYEHQQQQQQTQPIAQPQASNVSATAQPQPYYSQLPYYSRHLPPQSKHQQLQYQQQQQQHVGSKQLQSHQRPAYPQQQQQRQPSAPFPKPSSDVPTRHTSTSQVYSPSSSSAVRPHDPHSPQKQQHEQKPLGNPVIIIPQLSGGSTQAPSMQIHTPYTQKTGSASTEDPSPLRTQIPTSPFSGPYQHTQPISSVMRSPTMRQRQRGQSMSSATASTSSRRRNSRAEHKSPYSRPTADAPHSPKAGRSPTPPTVPQSPRRTYRRHPKKDPNAPEKWRSAYQLFRDDINRELQGQDIPFSEMSKIHSRRWSELSDDKRNVYFQKSRRDKDEYVSKMAIYEQTPEFRQYNDYLEKFYQQESTVNRVGRPKGAKSSKGKGKGPDTSMPEDYDYDVSPRVGAAKPSMSLPSSSSPPPSASSHDDMPD